MKSPPAKRSRKRGWLPLQAQIAPHFIHNVLYTISIAAQEVRTGDVVSMCKTASPTMSCAIR